jgi:hypothetical protein
MNEPCWLYHGKCFTADQIKPGMKGFVYKITCLGGAYPGFIYIGSKSFESIRTKKLSKKRSNELYKGRGKKPTKEKVVSASNWESYTSSSKFLQALIEEYGRQTFQFEILEFGTSKSDLWYREVCQMIRHQVMETSRSFNECLSFKIYKKQLLKT